jgi:large subunit ribosomal protein L18
MRIRNQARKQKREIRHSRTVKKIMEAMTGTTKKFRLVVFRSSKHIYAQVVDDSKSITVVSANDKEISGPIKQEKKANRKVDSAYSVGKLIAEKAIKGKIKEIVFDRGGYQYHGRIKALADGAREGGLKF